MSRAFTVPPQTDPISLVLAMEGKLATIADIAEKTFDFVIIGKYAPWIN